MAVQTKLTSSRAVEGLLKADDDAPLKEQLQGRITALQNDEIEKEKLVRKAAQQSLDARITRRFFEDIYEILYSKSELERRPFLNIGPGSFRHKLWRTADKNYGTDQAAWTQMRRGKEQPPVDYYWDVYERKPLAEKDGFFKVIYCSHVIEHLFPEDAAFLCQEAYRLLAVDGVFRIVCPDASLFIRAYEAEDWTYFFHYLIVKTKRMTKPISRISRADLKRVCAEFMIEWVSLLAHKENPKRLTRDECVSFIDSYPSLKDAFDAACALSSRDLNMTVGGHVNWFDAAKLVDTLERAGFKDIKVNGYLQSEVPILRDMRHFDRTDPEMSIFVDASP